MNLLFTESEFEAALATSNTQSSPGLYVISFETLNRLPKTFLKMILDNYNDMFVESKFPESWRNTLLRFIPKSGGGYSLYLLPPV